ncbi:hypothetical protein ACFLWS_06380 [Chloroflexota bacterium]
METTLAILMVLGIFVGIAASTGEADRREDSHLLLLCCGLW